MVLPRHFEIHTPERLFAVDLIRHVYSQRNITYLASGNFSCFGPYGDTPFRRNVRETIDFLRAELAVPIQVILERFFSNGEINGPAFKIFLGSLALRMSIDEFNIMEFLEFSAVTSSLALLLFRVGLIESGNYAVEAIVTSVRNFRRRGLILDFNELEVFAGEFLEYGKDSYPDNRQGAGADADPEPHEGPADSGQPRDSDDPKGPSGDSVDPKGPSGDSDDPKGPSGDSDDPKGPSGDSDDPKGPSGDSDDPKGPSGDSDDPKDLYRQHKTC